MRIIITVLFLIFTFQSWTKADDIKDFQIEEMSIGDSLLDYFSETKIKSIQNKYHDKGYMYKSKDYYFITIKSPKFNLYDSIQVALKDRDKKYIIQSLVGIQYLDINECYSQFDSIEKTFDPLFENSRKVDKEKRKHVYDKSGKSFTTDVYYYPDDGSYAALVCTDWSEKIHKETNWRDSLRVELGSSDFAKWFEAEAY